MAELSMEVGALVSEFENSRYAAESICSVMDELFQNFSGVLGVFSVSLQLITVGNSALTLLTCSNFQDIYA